MKTNFQNKPILLVAAGICILVVLLFVIFGGKTSTTENATTGAEAPAMPVAALRLSREMATVFEELPGRVVAYQTAEIRPQVSGILKEQLFIEGSYVEEGAALYQIDPAPYEAFYRSAQASLEKANANLLSLEITSQRFKKLIKTDAVSQQEYEDNNVRYAQAQADLGIAKAALTQAKINLDFTKVNAPIAGKIGKSQVTKGALVTANQSASLATITQVNPIYVDMNLPGSSLNYLREKLGTIDNIPVVIFATKNSDEIAHRGVLKFHEVTVDPSTSAVQLRAEFENQNTTLLPGLFVRAALQLEFPNIMRVPQKVTQRQPDGGLAVWVVGEDGSVNLKPFIEERALGDQWIVQSGLNEGDVIVTEGMMKMQPGAKVIANFASEHAAPETTSASAAKSPEKQE